MTDLDIKNVEDLILNEKFKEALIKIDYLFEEEPNNITLLEKYGDCLFNLKDYEQAMNYHSKAYELDKDNQAIKSKLFNDIHFKETSDQEKKTKKIKNDFVDYKSIFSNFLNKKLL